MVITNQAEFNKETVRALKNLYLLQIIAAGGTDDCGEDVAVRQQMADLDAFAFADDYAALGLPEQAPPSPEY